MELTPEIEAALKAIPSLTKQVEELKPLAAEVTTLKTSLAAKDAEIAELKKDTSGFKSSAALQAMKTEYPDVPEATLAIALSMPADQRKLMLDPVQKSVSESKAALAVKTDPLKAWENAGSIMPATEAERAAQKKDREQAYVEHSKTGNVFGMLEQRGSEVIAHLRRSFAGQPR